MPPSARLPINTVRFLKGHLGRGRFNPLLATIIASIGAAMIQVAMTVASTGSLGFSLRITTTGGANCSREKRGNVPFEAAGIVYECCNIVHTLIFMIAKSPVFMHPRAT